MTDRALKSYIWKSDRHSPALQLAKYLRDNNLSEVAFEFPIPVILPNFTDYSFLMAGIWGA